MTRIQISLDHHQYTLSRLCSLLFHSFMEQQILTGCFDTVGWVQEGHLACKGERERYILWEFGRQTIRKSEVSICPYSPLDMASAMGVAGFFQGKANGEQSPKGPKRVGVLGDGLQAPSPPPRESGERCELPQRGPGRSSGANRFLYNF